MKRVPLVLALATLLISAGAPGAAAAGPSAAIDKPGGCSTLVYSWSNFRKAHAAEFRIHHFGLFEASRSTAPVSASGTFGMPADVTFIEGDHYTVLGVLLDSRGRAITPSAAVWWGTC